MKTKIGKVTIDIALGVTPIELKIERVHNGYIVGGTYYDNFDNAWQETLVLLKKEYKFTN